MNLILIGSTKCAPCAIMKNQISSEMEFLDKNNVTFDYINLDELEDKDMFIQANGITCTPTTWIMKDGLIEKEFSGYIGVDELIENIKYVGGIK